MRFYLVSASQVIPPKPINIDSLEELLCYLDYEGGCNDLIISRRSLVSMSHDKRQEATNCPYVLCLYDQHIEK